MPWALRSININFGGPFMCSVMKAFALDVFFVVLTPESKAEDLLMIESRERDVTCVVP